MPSSPPATLRAAPTGIGLGLRWDFLQDVSEAPRLPVDFFEISPENYMRRGGYYPEALFAVSARYPIVSHGLTMSLGATAAPDASYLETLRGLLGSLRTPWHSDHLCFSSSGATTLHELLPLKFSRAAATRVADNMRRAEDALGLPMAAENISWYAHPGHPELSEPEFIHEVVERSGGGLLLDVNNVYVNSQNHGFDPVAFLAALPLERVMQLHVAGHTRLASGLLLDTHGADVCDPVLELLGFVVERTGPVPVLLERDNAIPELPELLREVATLRRVYDAALERRAASPRGGPDSRAALAGEPRRAPVPTEHPRTLGVSP